jgi:hypothetical protein
MSEETTTEAVEEEAEKETGKGLRAQLEASIKREKKLKSTILDSAYEAIGLDTSTGLGKAISKEYEGEASEEALTEYAKDEYGWVAPEASEVVHPEAVAIAQATEQLEKIGQTAGSVSTPTEGDDLAKAEAEGDYATTMAIKGQQVVDMFNQ